jgi:hypothetical protein
MKILHRSLLYDNNCNFFSSFFKIRNKHGKQETNKHFLSNNRNCRRRTTYRNLVKILFWRIFSASNKGRTVRNFKRSFSVKILSIRRKFQQKRRRIILCLLYFIDIYKYSSHETVSLHLSLAILLSKTPTFSKC